MFWDCEGGGEWLVGWGVGRCWGGIGGGCVGGDEKDCGEGESGWNEVAHSREAAHSRLDPTQQIARNSKPNKQDPQPQPKERTYGNFSHAADPELHTLTSSPLSTMSFR